MEAQKRASQAEKQFISAKLQVRWEWVCVGLQGGWRPPRLGRASQAEEPLISAQLQVR